MRLSRIVTEKWNIPLIHPETIEDANFCTQYIVSWIYLHV